MADSNSTFVWEGIEWEKRIFWDFGEIREEIGEVSWVGRRKLCKKRSMIYNLEWLEGYWYDSFGVFWCSEVEGCVVEWAPEVVAVDLRVTHWESIVRKIYENCIDKFGSFKDETSYMNESLTDEEAFVFKVQDEDSEGFLYTSFIEQLFWLLIVVVLYFLFIVLI